MPPNKPETEEEADQKPLRPWELAKVRHVIEGIDVGKVQRIIERSERIAWAWGVVKAAAGGATLILGTWLLLKEQIMDWLGRGGGTTP